MAAGDPYVGCSNPTIGVLELLNAISVKVTATGVGGIRVYSTTAAGETLSPEIVCAGDLDSLEVFLRKKIVLDANGDPALHLITAT